MDAQANIGQEAAEKLTRYSDNGTTASYVNMPEVALPAHDGCHRLLLIHRNVPGMLSAINSIFSELGVNIAGQYLQMNEVIGYVVIDIDADHSEAAVQRLRTLEGSLRCRILF